MTPKTKSHAAQYGPLYGALLLLGAGGGASQLEVVHRAFCGDQQAALTAVAAGYSVAVSVQADRAGRAEAALEKCAVTLSRRCR